LLGLIAAGRLRAGFLALKPRTAQSVQVDRVPITGE